MTNKIQTLKGFRDLLPEEKRLRDAVANKIEQVFKRFGFEPLETPTLEYADLLLGKYGEEADQLVYTFTDRGDREVGLRYDQTVPVSRVISQYQNQLPKFFRRYQIQNVFRADKPQRGRFREFTQCDCDIFGTTTAIADAEILAVFYQVYKALGLDSIIIEVNDRQTLLSTLKPFATEDLDVFAIIQTIDKLDKKTTTEVIEELIDKGLPKSTAKTILAKIEEVDISNNLANIVDKTVELGVPRQALKFNPKLARGLDYYTGLIFEGRIPEFKAGSVGAGGRYDNLIKELSGLEMPAVGFGIGFDRTVQATQKFGSIKVSNRSAEVMLTLFEEKYLAQTLNLANQLRQANIAVEIYPELDKLGKQVKLANQKNIPFVIILGDDEAAKGKISLKDMQSGQQQLVTTQKAIELIKAEQTPN